MEKKKIAQQHQLRRRGGNYRLYARKREMGRGCGLCPEVSHETTRPREKRPREQLVHRPFLGKLSPYFPPKKAGPRRRKRKKGGGQRIFSSLLISLHKKKKPRGGEKKREKTLKKGTNPPKRKKQRIPLF